jgi:hypothetical protein
MAKGSSAKEEEGDAAGIDSLDDPETSTVSVLFRFFETYSSP